MVLLVAGPTYWRAVKWALREDTAIATPAVLQLLSIFQYRGIQLCIQFSCPVIWIARPRRRTLKVCSKNLRPKSLLFRVLPIKTFSSIHPQFWAVRYRACRRAIICILYCRNYKTIQSRLLHVPWPHAWRELRFMEKAGKECNDGLKCRLFDTQINGQTLLVKASWPVCRLCYPAEPHLDLEISDRWTDTKKEWYQP